LSDKEIEENLMATLAGQRAQFTWALNQYNLSEDPETRAKFAKRMAKYIASAPANGFTVDQVTQGQIYPSSEVDQYINDPGVNDDPGITEEQAIRTVEETVDTSDVTRIGEGTGVVYAYGYPSSAFDPSDRSRKMVSPSSARISACQAPVRSRL
jgi:hypothetical protein